MSEIKFELKGVNGQLYVYEDKIVIERKGFWGFMNYGLAGSKTIPMTTIQTVQYKGANMFCNNGYIQLGLIGCDVRGGALNAAKDENSVLLNEDLNELGKEIKDYIENIIMSKTKEVSQQISVADELMKLKQLLDMGILTQEEFDAKKKQLLSI